MGVVCGKLYKPLKRFKSGLIPTTQLGHNACGSIVKELKASESLNLKPVQSIDITPLIASTNLLLVFKHNINLCPLCVKPACVKHTIFRRSISRVECTEKTFHIC